MGFSLPRDLTRETGAQSGHMFYNKRFLSTFLAGSIDRTYVIIGSSVSSIIFIGIAVILISRLMLEFHYRREYDSFLKAKEAEVWEDVRERTAHT